MSNFFLSFIDKLLGSIVRPFKIINHHFVDVINGGTDQNILWESLLISVNLSDRNGQFYLKVT